MCEFHQEKAGEELKHDNRGFDMLYYVHSFILVLIPTKYNNLREIFLYEVLISYVMHVLLFVLHVCVL